MIGRLAGLVALALLTSVLPVRGASNGYGPAYLVYAGPYSASPSSAFGHLFLALADEPDQPPPLWRVITFNAETFGATPIRFVSVGIAGGFLGRFSEVPFHEKTREYGVLDDRDLWFIELELSASERAALETALEAERRSWYPYTFFGRNCAFYLQTLLARVTDAVVPPAGIVAPIDVFGEVSKSRVGGQTWFRRSASRRIRDSAEETLRPEVADRLKRDDWKSVAADTLWHGQLQPEERQLLREYLSLRQATARARLPNDVTVGIAKLRVSDLSGTDGSRDGTVLPGEPVEAPTFHRYSRMRLLGVSPTDGAERLALEFRAAMHDEYDPWQGTRPLNTMELLAFRLSIAHERPALRVDEVVVFAQRSLAPSTWVRSQSSWMLELLGRRGGLLSDDGFHAELRAGSGATRHVGGSVFLYGLGTMGLVGEFGGGATVVPGLELGAVSLMLKRLRWGVRWTHERDLMQWRRRSESLRVWGRVDLSGSFGLVGTWVDRPGLRAFQLGVDWYP